MSYAVFLEWLGTTEGFAKIFASVVSPLTDLLSSERRFVWNPECESGFQAAKDLLCNAPVLSAPNFTRPFQLQVDASAHGAGAVLLQQDRFVIEHPICYFL